MKIITCEQGSAEWHDARRGVPTASRMGRILTPKTLKLSAQADDLICELVGERFSLIPPEWAESYTSRAMEWGAQTEDEARRWYAMERNLDVEQVGFCLTDDGRFGCSPDGLVGRDGVLELKCPQAGTQVGYLLAGELPPEYRAQCAGALIVTGRPWLDFLSYCPGLPPFLLRVVRDEYSEALEAALPAFWTRYQEKLALIAKMLGASLDEPVVVPAPRPLAPALAPRPDACNAEQRDWLLAEARRRDMDDDELDAVLSRYGVRNVEDLTTEQATDLQIKWAGRRT